MFLSKNTEQVQSWRDFVKENLVLEDKVGSLRNDLSGTHMQYFVSLFNAKCKSTKEYSNSEVSLPGTKLKFKVIQKTFTRIYGTACDQNGTGLLINLLPIGILVCLFHHPFTWQSAVRRVECFCDKLCR